MTKDDGGPATRDCRHCGEPFPPKSWQLAKGDYECPSCKRSRQNAGNAKRDLSAYAKARYTRPDVKDAYRQYHERKRATDPEYAVRRAARRKVATEIEAGRMAREACQVCSTEDADAHHDDYSRPLDVIWLCRAHHMERHRMLAARKETTGDE